MRTRPPTDVYALGEPGRRCPCCHRTAIETRNYLAVFATVMTVLAGLFLLSAL